MFLDAIQESDDQLISLPCPPYFGLEITELFGTPIITFCPECVPTTFQILSVMFLIATVIYMQNENTRDYSCNDHRCNLGILTAPREVARSFHSTSPIPKQKIHQSSKTMLTSDTFGQDCNSVATFTSYFMRNLLNQKLWEFSRKKHLTHTSKL